MGSKAYKLGEYKIIESGIGELRWEAHSGFAEFQQGRCFRKGKILFIGPAENDQMGFLKGDFLNHIRTFPVWSKTRYCCSAFEIYHCKTGKRVAKKEMLIWMLGPDGGEGGRASKEGTFRLGRYEITRKMTGQIVWKTAPGPNTVREGTGTILEDILFIGSRQNTQSHLIRRQFLWKLQQLPKWEQTEYYCPRASLYDCKSWNNVKKEWKTWPSGRRATEKRNARKRGKSARFKPARSDLWKGRAMHFSRWARKSITYVAGLLLHMISLSFAYLIRHCSEIKKRWNYKKGKRSSVHHIDDQM